jgi:hypothetical protein
MRTLEIFLSLFGCLQSTKSWRGILENGMPIGASVPIFEMPHSKFFHVIHAKYLLRIMEETIQNTF